MYILKLEDEFHLLFQCTLYTQLRQELIKPFYTLRCSKQSCWCSHLIQKSLKNLSVYVHKCFRIRNETMLNPWSNFLFFHAHSFIICISLHVLVILVEILLNIYFIFSGSACFLILLKICSFMLLLNAIRHIWHSHTVRYDNVINQDFVFYHCSLKGQNDLLWILLVKIVMFM